MNTASTSLGAQPISASSRAMQLGLAALLGLFIVGFVGFSQHGSRAQCRPRLSPFDGLSLPLTRD